VQARDIMTTNVVTVGPEVPILAVARMLAEHRISGLPVVDNQNNVVGIITEGDLLRRSELGTEKGPSLWQELFVSDKRYATEYLQARGTTAGAVMTRHVVHVAPDTPIAAVVALFEKRRIKRVPVIDNGRLVGIISRGNLVQALACIADRIAAPTTDDRRIRDQVLAEFRRLPRAADPAGNVVVLGGIVHLWGLPSAAAEQVALREAAEALPGVRGVEDHTIPPPDASPPR
jgi:CBS domain-containing protein